MSDLKVGDRVRVSKKAPAGKFLESGLDAGVVDNIEEQGLWVSFNGSQSSVYFNYQSWLTKIDEEENQPVKHDTDKPRMSYVMNGFADALLMVGMVGTKGAEVHGDNTWQNIENPIERYNSALWRHKLQGGTIDPQFDLLHDAHAAWNALAVLQLRLNSTLNKS